RGDPRPRPDPRGPGALGPPRGRRCDADRLGARRRRPPPCRRRPLRPLSGGRARPLRCRRHDGGSGGRGARPRLSPGRAGRRARLRALLRPVGDLERLTSRAALGQAHARDLVGLRACLAPLGELREACRGLEASLLAAAADLADLESLRALLEAALVDEPPLTLHDGRIIRETWNEALRAIVRDASAARDWIAGLEERERVRTGIPSLRVRFNR